METAPKTTKPKPTRWWPAIVILGVFALTLGLVLYAMSEDQASRALTILGATTLTSILLLAWMLFFSRLPKRTRLLNFGGLVGAIVLFSTCFRFSQFSGNMIPMFEWRWIRNTLPTAATHAANPNNNSLTKLSFPQFLGPNRDCKVIGPDLATDWTTQSPEKLWRQPIGPAWSGFVIAGSRAVTQEQRAQNEAVVCYDLQTGTVLWQQTNVGHYKTAIAGEGPRATPTIHDSKVYTLGASGMLNCLELATGKPVWQRSVVTDAGLNVDETIDQIGILDNRNKSKEWGYSCSPLILKNLVIVSAGGDNGKSLISYDRITGKLIWSGGSSRAGYSSPRLSKLHGHQQILIFNQDGLAAHSTTDGSIVWGFDWNVRYPHVSVPLTLPGNKILLSLGYGKGSKLLQVNFNEDKFSATELWKSNRMKAKFTNLIFHNDHIFGLDDGMFACIGIERGRRKWKEGRYGHGQILLRGDHILVMAENGDVVLLEANAEQHVELTRFAALDGKTWNPPALAGEYLLVRNHREAACYKLPLAKPAKIAAQ